MPPKKRPSSSAGTAYESDNDAPRSKKVKKVKTAKKSKNDDDDDDDDEGRVRKKMGEVGKEGDVFWGISDKRRIAVSEFKGKHMVAIREYYEKDGEQLPSKKGIALPLEQWNAILRLLPHIETVLAEKGHSVERPDYSGAGASAAAAEADEEEDEEEEVKGKKNFEETSDEED